MSRFMRSTLAAWGAAFLLCAGLARAEVCNLKVVTDASPDYSDLPSMVHSMTSRWPTPQEKCWAVFYWNHKARRQTNPMSLHGMALTDPVRQFNDYGFTMCSTISGVNQSIWEAMGLKHRYWDISNHTVSEVFYDGGWHLYDNSMSAIYTLCDGKTLAGVADVGAEGACEASGGRREPGHVAKYHCLTATSPRGFLTGADCARSLDEEYRCFNPNGLKLRTYFYDWDQGHRYVLNLRPGEVYTRHYHKLGDSPEFFVPNSNGKDPELTNPRYGLRGNGRWELRLDEASDAETWKAAAHDQRGVSAGPGGKGFVVAAASAAGEVLFKVSSANVTTAMTIEAAFEGSGSASIDLSTTNGLRWTEAWSGNAPGKADLALVKEVNGAYETLVRVRLSAAQGQPIRLARLVIRTTTQLNSKTQPKLNLGRNVVYVGAGDQTDSIVLWPELQGDAYKTMIVEERNVRSAKEHIGYQGVLYPQRAKEDAYVVYRVDAPREITRLTFGGRFYNRAPKSRIEMHWSADGKTWTKAWELTDTAQPWDIIRYETVKVGGGARSVWVKYLMNTTDPAPSGCSIYAVRIEANHRPADAAPRPVEVTFTWKERQADRSLVERSHTQLVEKLPATYVVNVGGDDHPVMESLAVALKGTRPDVRYGYSDGKDVGGEKHVDRWVKYGRNLAVGAKYTVTPPSETNWEAGDPDGTKLTDGVAGPPYAGGISYRYGLIWSPRARPVITVDLGQVRSCASFGLNVHGYPGHDALKGQVQDKVMVSVSEDGQAFADVGLLDTDLKWKDLPANHFYPDEETITGHTFRVIPAAPVKARFVRYTVTSPRHFCATEVEVLDAITFEPFDLRVALPADAAKAGG